MQTAPQALSEQCVQLKGSLVPMTVMELMDDDREQVESSLMSIISQAPGFFEDTPVIIALEKFNDQNKPINFESLLATCALLRIKPVAVRGGSNLQQMAAIKAGLVLMPAAKSKVTPNGVNQEPPAAAAEQPKQNVQNADKKVSLHNRPTDHTADSHETESEAKETIITASSQKTETSPPEIPPTLTELEPVPTKVIYNPVRSGQQVYAKGGDLIVLAAVSPGAEILADGNIHVYGPLRGRALAGVKGDIKARIFCQSMEAELVSIAGQYKISEDLQKNGWKTSSQVHLVEDKLTISPLTPQL